MGYPIYKLLRAVNRQYPNNGFINYVDVREDTYDDMIDEDLRDLINETIQEVYIDVALDEVYSFPTVPGQNQYVLPEDCDLRDIQEVTRTFVGIRGPLPTPPRPGPGPEPEPFDVVMYFDANGGTGTMEPVEVTFGTKYVLPECGFTAPEDKEFDCWVDNAGEEHQPRDEVFVYQDETFSAKWKDSGTGHRYGVNFYNAVDDPNYITFVYKPLNGVEESDDLYYGQSRNLRTGTNGTLGSSYEYIKAYYQGEEFGSINLELVYTQNTNYPLVHPTIEGEGTGHRPTTGDNEGDDNPLSGDGTDDSSGSGTGHRPATPSTTPDDENPLGGD